jgi:MFS family permease
MLAAASLARTGATMVGLTMGFVAYEQTEFALIVAIVVSAFGLAFALASLVAGHVLQHVGLQRDAGRSARVPDRWGPGACQRHEQGRGGRGLAHYLRVQ